MELPVINKTLYAPAKINLFLHVTGKREDGYHDLFTRMQKLDLYDVIEMKLFAGKGIELECDEPGVPVDENNLVVRAAKLFLSASKKSKGYAVKLKLTKNIPVAAGLGGGSSDAGSLLQVLNDIFEQELSEAELIDIARTLGADVPFFVTSHAAVIAENIGDVMYPVDSIGDVSFVLVNPDFFISTASVFQRLSLTRPSKNSTLSCFQKREAEAFSLDDMHNDLEQVTCAAHKEINEIKADLLATGASKVLMSGSGPTVFGVYPDSLKNNSPRLLDVVESLRQKYGKKVYLSRACTGAWPSGKAPGFDPGIRRFESCRPSHH